MHKADLSAKYAIHVPLATFRSPYTAQSMKIAAI